MGAVCRGENDVKIDTAYINRIAANQKHIAAHKDIIAAKDVRKSEIKES